MIYISDTDGKGFLVGFITILGELREYVVEGIEGDDEIGTTYDPDKLAKGLILSNLETEDIKLLKFKYNI